MTDYAGQMDVAAVIAVVVPCALHNLTKKALVIARSNAFVVLAFKDSGHLRKK